MWQIFHLLGIVTGLKLRLDNSFKICLKAFNLYPSSNDLAAAILRWRLTSCKASIKRFSFWLLKCLDCMMQYIIFVDIRKGKMNMDIVQLQKLLNVSSNIKWSKHCLERMQERDISIADATNRRNYRGISRWFSSFQLSYFWTYERK